MDFKELNNQRKKSANKVIIGIVLFAVAFLLLIIWQGDLFVPAAIIFIVGIILASTGALQFKKVNETFKTKYLTQLIQETFENVTYEPKQGLPKATIYRDGLLKKADRFHSEDLIKGSFSGVNFVTCDLKLEERHVRHTKNGMQTYYVTYFLGRFFEFEFPKSFKGKIVTTEGSIMTWFSSLKRVELESIEFNKKFKTYSSDELNAFYVLTPHLMESLLELERQNPGTISCAFIDNRLTIAINNNKDTFELSLFKEISEQSILEMKREMNVIRDIIEELRLNRKIYNN